MNISNVNTFDKISIILSRDDSQYTDWELKFIKDLPCGKSVISPPPKISAKVEAIIDRLFKAPYKLWLQQEANRLTIQLETPAREQLENWCNMYGGISCPSSLIHNGGWQTIGTAVTENGSKRRAEYVINSGIGKEGVPYVHLMARCWQHGAPKDEWLNWHSGTDNLIWNIYVGDDVTVSRADRRRFEKAAKDRATRSEAAKLVAEEKQATDLALRLQDIDDYHNRFSTKPTDLHFSYLASKGLPPAHIPGARYGHDQFGHFFAFLIRNYEGVATGIQKIYLSGDKMFSKGKGWITGCFILIDDDPLRPLTINEVIRICEGRTTGEANRLALDGEGFTFVCALNAQNILPVAQKIAKYHSAVIDCDNDFWHCNEPVNKWLPFGKKKGNAGAKGIDAAKSLGIPYTLPPMGDLQAADHILPQERQQGGVSRPPKLATDFDDLYYAFGAEHIKTILMGIADQLPILPEPIKYVSLDKANECVTQSVERVIKEGGHIILAASPGASKTRQTVQALIAQHEAALAGYSRIPPTEIIVPTHLIGETEYADPLRKAGIRVQVQRGRSAVVPSCDGGDGCERMCKKHETVNRVAGAVNVYEHFCVRTKGRGDNKQRFECEYYKECVEDRYLSQFENHIDVRILPHQSLALDRSELEAKQLIPDQLVIDEAFINNQLKHTAVYTPEFVDALENVDARSEVYEQYEQLKIKYLDTKKAALGIVRALEDAGQDLTIDQLIEHTHLSLGALTPYIVELFKANIIDCAPGFVYMLASEHRARLIDYFKRIKPVEPSRHLESDELNRLGLIIIETLRAKKPLLKALRDEGFDADNIRGLMEALPKGAVLDLSPEMTESSADGKISAFMRSLGPYPAVKRILRGIIEELEQCPRDECYGVNISDSGAETINVHNVIPVTRIVTTNKDFLMLSRLVELLKINPQITAKQIKQRLALEDDAYELWLRLERLGIVTGKYYCENPFNLVDGWETYWLDYAKSFVTPTLILDADANHQLLSQVLPFAQLFDYQKVDIKPNARIVQLSSGSLSKTSLALYPQYGQIVKGILQEQLDEGKKPALVGPLAFVGSKERGIDGKVGLFDEVPRLWYNNLRGSNELGDCDTLTAIGRNLPPSHVIDDTLRAMFRFADDLQFIGDKPFPKLPTAYLTSDGSFKSHPSIHHPDQRGDKILEQFCHAESRQTIHRIRPVRAVEPKNILILSDIMLPGVPIDDFLTMDEIIQAPHVVRTRSIMEQMFKGEDAPGLLPLASQCLTELFQGEFGSLTAAKNWVNHLIIRDLEKVRDPILNVSYIGGLTFNRSVELVTYRLDGQRRPSRMILGCGADDAVKWIEEKTGRRVVEFAEKRLDGFYEISEPVVPLVASPAALVMCDLADEIAAIWEDGQVQDFSSCLSALDTVDELTNFALAPVFPKITRLIEQLTPVPPTKDQVLQIVVNVFELDIIKPVTTKSEACSNENRFIQGRVQTSPETGRLAL